MRLDRGRVGWFTRTSWTRPWCAAMGEGAGHDGGDAGGGGMGGEQVGVDEDERRRCARCPWRGGGHGGGPTRGHGIPGGMQPRRRRPWCDAATAAASLVVCGHGGGPTRGRGGGGALPAGGEEAGGGSVVEVSSAFWRRGRRLKEKLTCGPHTSVS